MQTATATANYIEIRAFGLQRSGNHAILSWVRSQHAGKPACFLNDIRHGDFDPYRTCANNLITALDTTASIETLRIAPKHLLIYSYEDDAAKMDPARDFLESIDDSAFLRNRERYLQPSQNVFDLLILRDPFNFFASRCKKLEALSGIKDLSWIARNWKLLAAEALRWQANPSPHKIFANYNLWVEDASYRKQLSQGLLGTFTDASREAVSKDGGGSSFDSMAYDGLALRSIVANWKKLLEFKRYRYLDRYLKRFVTPRATAMKVTERWKLLANDATYRRIFADRELLELSEEIFGEITGTREFVKEVGAS